jgi:hypothetical protein
MLMTGMVFFFCICVRFQTQDPNMNQSLHTEEGWDSFEIKWVEKDGWSKTWNTKGWIYSPYCFIYEQIIHDSNVRIQPSHTFCHVRNFTIRYLIMCFLSGPLRDVYIHSIIQRWCLVNSGISECNYVILPMSLNWKTPFSFLYQEI